MSGIKGDEEEHPASNSAVNMLAMKIPEVHWCRSDSQSRMIAIAINIMRT